MTIQPIQSLEVVVPRDRKRQRSAMMAIGTLPLPLIILLVTGLFRVHDPSTRLIFMIMLSLLSLAVLFNIWLSFWALRSPFLLRVNQEGIRFIDAHLLLFREVLIPWSEIARLSCFYSKRLGLLFTITLKDPERWWSLYGNGHRRTIRPKQALGYAHFGINQQFATVSLPEIMQQIRRNNLHEIQQNMVEIAFSLKES